MFENVSILYVEDDPLSREIMTMMVENILHPKTFVMLEHSEDFLSRVHTIDPAPTLIMLDIHVKPLNGFQMLELLRQDENLKHVKIIALTASVMNEEVEQLRASGFDGAIAKPLSIQTFPELIQRVLSGDAVWYIAD